VKWQCIKVGTSICDYFYIQDGIPDNIKLMKYSTAWLHIFPFSFHMHWIQESLWNLFFKNHLVCATYLHSTLNCSRQNFADFCTNSCHNSCDLWPHVLWLHIWNIMHVLQQHSILTKHMKSTLTETTWGKVKINWILNMQVLACMHIHTKPMAW